MSRHLMAFWLAGLLMGTGIGLIVGRGVPPVPLRAEAFSEPSPRREGVPSSEFSHLFNPRQFPELPPARDAETGVEARKASTPVEPRLLPEGEASPVTRNGSLPPGISPAGDAHAGDFRRELQEQAPDLTEEAIDELERIRNHVEAEATKPEPLKSAPE
ncbi:MAG: hypothetical protein R3C12_01490 [Planctomycetaceae bacterium]|nr:hypothetical protein [Planctomycetaceae bacterium]